MASAAEVQALLRFLTQDAKVPLPTAMSKVKELHKAGLTSPSALFQSDIQTIQLVFLDEKLAKQVFNAAKRTSKKRTSTEGAAGGAGKRPKKSFTEDPPTPTALEESLSLPCSTQNEDGLAQIILITNRAPLVLAFAVTLLKYTMPEQPLSSRLSLAQAVVSANSRSKAVSLGLEKGRSAEDEGWGSGQPVAKIMGREIRVLTRWGYAWKEDVKVLSAAVVKAEEPAEEQDGLVVQVEHNDQAPALWGLDLEALRSSNGPQTSATPSSTTSNLSIYTAQSARAYLMKSFSSPPKTSANDIKASSRKKSATGIAMEKEENLGLLLSALDLLYTSWAPVLNKDELDRRAWS
ncbi:MAG: hypothetical protein M1830_001741 [Pleopsidium flavum]|nr:MAG: hypothetical protein M1830_001741 [Pleopsidium flavum]